MLSLPVVWSRLCLQISVTEQCSPGLQQGSTKALARAMTSSSFLRAAPPTAASRLPGNGRASHIQGMKLASR